MRTKCKSQLKLIFNIIPLNPAFSFGFEAGSCDCLNYSLNYTVAGCGQYYSWLPRHHGLCVSHSARSTLFPYIVNHPSSKKKIQNLLSFYKLGFASALTLSLMCPFSVKKVSMRAKFCITSLSPVPLIAILTFST